MDSFKGRIALVTGASRGIGRAVALGLAEQGAHIIALARTIGALEELDDDIRKKGGEATLVPLDLKDGKKVDAIGPTLYQHFDHLDILVGNAATLGPLSPLAHIKDLDWQDVLDINLTANWRLLRTCDPLLKRSEASRTVFVTSGAARAKRAYWSAYAASKAGLEALVGSYADELNNSPHRVNLIDPGPVATNMRQKAFPGEDPDSLPKPEELVSLFLEYLSIENNKNGTSIRFEPKQKEKI